MRRFLPLAATALLALPAAPALGSIYVVDVDTDANSTCIIGSCSLREAVHAANTDMSSNIDTVDLDGRTVHLTITGKNEDDNATGDIDVGTSSTATTAGQLVVTNGTIVAGNGDRVFHVLRLGESLKLVGVTVQGGDATTSTVDYGGGVYMEDGSTLQVSSSTFTGNSAGTGGALATDTGSTTTVDIAQFDHNTSTYGGGGILAYGDLTVDRTTFTANGANGRGGAIDDLDGTLTVTRSRFEGNTTHDSGGGLSLEVGSTGSVATSSFIGNTAGGVGGGVFVQSTAGVTATNITVSGNTANDTTSFGGGGISIQGKLALEHATVAANTGPKAPDVGFVSGTLTVTNTLVSGTCRLGDAATVVSVGGNVDSGVSCGFADPADRRSQTIRLGPVTHDYYSDVVPLLGGSGAIDAAVAANCAATDQRGITRIPTECDAGAYEASKTDLRAALAASPSPLVLGGDLTLSLTAFNDGPRATGGVVGTLPLPAGAAFVSGTGDGGAPCSAGPPVTCPLGSLDPGASHTASVVVHPAAAGTLDFTGSVVADLAEAAPGNENAAAQAVVTTPAPVSDTTKPKVTLALRKGTTLRSIRRTRRIRVKVRVDEACKLTLRASTRQGGRTRSLGRAARTFASPGSATLSIRLTKAGLRRLLRTRRLTLSATATDAAGNAGKATRSARLRRR